MTDVESIYAAVFGTIAGIVLRDQGVNPQEIVNALDRVQDSLEQVRKYWAAKALEFVAETNLRNLQTESIQVELEIVRENVAEKFAYKVHKGSTAAKVFERNGWREIARKYSIRYYVMPDGSEPPEHLTPVVEFAVPTRDEIIGLANQLHAARKSARNDVDDLHLWYSPSSSYSAKNRAGKQFTRHHPARFFAHRKHWFISATWAKGDEKPPEWEFSDAGTLPEPALRLIVERERVER